MTVEVGLPENVDRWSEKVRQRMVAQRAWGWDLDEMKIAAARSDDHRDEHATEYDAVVPRLSTEAQ